MCHVRLQRQQLYPEDNRRESSEIMLQLFEEQKQLACRIQPEYRIQYTTPGKIHIFEHPHIFFIFIFKLLRGHCP